MQKNHPIGQLECESMSWVTTILVSFNWTFNFWIKSPNNCPIRGSTIVVGSS